MAFALHRAAPAILASAATVVARHALPAVRRDELHRRPGPGRSDRRRRHLPGDGHPAARAAGHRRPLDLLAQAARRSGRPSPPRPGFWARVGQPDRRASAQGLGGHHRAAAPWPASACSGSTPTGWRPRTATPRSSSRSPASRCWRTHGLVDASNTVMVVANADQADAVAEAMAGVDGIGEPSEPRHQGRRRLRRGRHRRRRRLARRPSTRVEEVRDAVHGVDGRRRPRGRLLGDLPRHQDRLQPRQHRDHPDHPAGRAPDPGAAAARARGATDPDRHRRAVVRGRAGHLRAAVRVRLRASPASDPAASRCSPSSSWWRSASTTTSS